MQQLIDKLHPFSDFRGADLTGANFRNAYLPKSDFTEAKLDGADFRGAILSRSIFNRASLDRVDFSGADLRGCFFFDLASSSIMHTTNANVRGAEFGKSPKFRNILPNLEGDSITIVGGCGVWDFVVDSRFVWLNDHWLDWLDYPCNILFHNGCGDTSPELFFQLEDPPGIVIANYQQRENYRKWGEHGFRTFPYIQERFQFLNPFSSQLEWINCLQKQYSFTASVGVIALEFFRRRPVREIFVTGMTLHQREDGSFPEHFNIHSTRAHWNYLKEVRRIDSRVKYDERLEEIVQLEDPLFS